MKRFAIIVLLAISSLGLRAQIAEAWISMPDSVCPFLSEQQRLSMMQYAKAGLTDTVVNLLDGKTYLDSINLQAGYISAQMTANMTLEMALESQAADASADAATTEVIRITKTVCAPICSTIVTWYDFAWNVIKREKQPWSIDQTDEDRLQHF